MGLFSHSVTQVGTQVQRVIEDNSLPNAIRDGVVQNLFDEDGGGDQMIEYVFDQLSNSIGLRANRMYNFGRQSYTFGLPNSSLHSSLAGEEATKAALATVVGTAVDLAYYHFGALNIGHHVWELLQNNYQYNAANNELVGLETGSSVYLVDFEVTLTTATAAAVQPASLEQWGPAPNSGWAPTRPYQPIGIGTWKPFITDPTATTDTVKVTYAWQDTVIQDVEGVTVAVLTPKTATLTMQLLGLDFDSEFHQAKYIKANGPAGYWSYKPGTGLYPDVDATFDTTYQVGGTFFPFGYMRFNKTNSASNKNSREYIDGKKLFNYMNMDFDAICSTIDANPDINDVEQAMMMMAVPADTHDPLELRYLCDFFGAIADNMTNATNGHGMLQILDMKIELGNAVPNSSIVIQDARFKMSLSFDSIVKEQTAGSIGPVNTYGWNYDGKGNYEYKKQITEVLYEVITLLNLKMTYFIRDGYTTTSDGDNQDILLIPLDVGIVSTYSIPDRETLYARALHYVFNSYVVTKLKWYETGIFKALLIIAAIVITVLSLGSAWASIAAAAAISTGTVLLVMMQILLKYILLSLAVKLFVKVVGVKFALIAAVVAALYGGYEAIEAGGLQGAPWAKDLLTISTSLSTGVQNQVKSDINDLLNDEKAFEQDVEIKEKALESAQELLNGDAHLNPLLILGENPNDFYQRTVHSGNIGVLGIDAISSYVDLTLQLPKFSETLGAIYG